MKMLLKNKNVPVGTFHRIVESGKTAVIACKIFLGHYRPIFTGNQERELANFILLMESKKRVESFGF